MPIGARGSGLLRPPARSAALLLFLGSAVAAVSCAPRAGHDARVVAREETRGDERYRMRSELRPPRGTLGDAILWRLSADLPRRVEIGPPVRGPSAPGLDWSPTGGPRVQDRGGRRHWEWSTSVRGFDLGAVALPRVALPLRRGLERDTLEFPADTLRVDSLTQAATGESPPSRGPIAPELRPIDWAVAAGLALGILLAAMALIRSMARRRAAAEGGGSPPPTAEEAFRDELRSIRDRASGLARDAFYEGLAAAVRRYAAASTGIPALDRTTTELGRELENIPRVDAAARRRLLGILHRADLAKFARDSAAEEDRLRAIDEALTLAGALVRAPAGPSPAAGPAGEAAPDDGGDP